MLQKVFLSLLVMVSVIIPQTESLKVLTINAWSGLDYQGNILMGEYEKSEKKEERFLKLAGLIIAQKPDVIFIQEANPVSLYSSRLAHLIDYDEIHQVCNAGIKIGHLGFPINLKEGIIILAKRGLKLKKADTWKLSGSFGVYGDAISMHFDQSAFALAGKITVNNTPLYLVNIHISYCPADDSLMIRKYEQLAYNKGYSSERKEEIISKIKNAAERRNGELKALKEKIIQVSAEHAVIAAGDFNITPDDENMKKFITDCGLRDTYLPEGPESSFTWDPERNVNISFSTSTKDANGKEINDYDQCCAIYDSFPRRIDYIFLNENFQRKDITDNRILSSEPEISDHFAVTSVVSLDNVIKNLQKEQDEFQAFSEKSVEPLPIISYDNDAGLGYGLKAFLLNYLRLNESLDLTAFNSTNGERWYRLVFSLPDMERRQGKTYPFAFDLVIDYDKWIKNSFYGTGSKNDDSGKEYYTKEPLEISITAGRGFTTELIGQAGMKYKNIKSYGFESSGDLIKMPEKLNAPDINYYSLFMNLRYDTRNSFINPDEGLVLQCEGELSLKQSFEGENFSRFAGTLQYYTTLFYPKTILASRLIIQSLQGDQFPLQMLLPLGGNSTLRGYPQDRFIDKSVSLFNSELRFPLFRRLGGIMGIDCGKAAPGINKLSFKDWAVSPAAGLRFYMDTFIIRLDMGFSNENMGIYFNFNHIF